MELFQKAKAVFVPGLADQKNVLGAFRKNFQAKGEQKTELIIAAHTFYRVYLNGAWLGIGPVTAPFGYLKADRYDLTELIRPEAAENQLAIEVIGYIPEQNFATNETSCLIGGGPLRRRCPLCYGWELGMRGAASEGLLRGNTVVRQARPAGGIFAGCFLYRLENRHDSGRHGMRGAHDGSSDSGARRLRSGYVRSPDAANDGHIQYESEGV